MGKTQLLCLFNKQSTADATSISLKMRKSQIKDPNSIHSSKRLQPLPRRAPARPSPSDSFSQSQTRSVGVERDDTLATSSFPCPKDTRGLCSSLLRSFHTQNHVSEYHQLGYMETTTLTFRFQKLENVETETHVWDNANQTWEKTLGSSSPDHHLHCIIPSLPRCGQSSTYR